VSAGSALAPAGGVRNDRHAQRRGLVVLALGVGLALLALVTLPLDQACVSAFTAAVLVVLSATDLERRVIPNRIVLPAAAIVLLAQFALFPDRAGEWALAAVLAAVALMLPQLLGRAWMGMGDVKLALLIGAALGWGVVGALLIAFVSTLPVTLLVLARGGLAARKTAIPFGPFLALGAIVVMFGPTLLGLSSG
jgi:leader peptidase (prepilin peptidase)/N-methyltransferase